MKKILLFLFLLILTSLFPSGDHGILLHPVHADTTAFTTSVNATYTITDDGNAHLVFNGILTNTTDKYYASSYSLQTGFEHVSNVSAYDSGGTINPTLKTDDGKTTISLPFNRHVAGLGNAATFSFSLDTTDVAKKLGSVWEVNIPSIAGQSDFKDLTITINVPSDFSTPSIVKPPKNGPLIFTKDDLKSAGIFLTFGTNQTYTFSLSYHVKNTNIFPVTTEIALPPTTNYQDVTITSISPKPLNVFTDNDGNWLAQYSLLPSQQLDAVAKGTVTLHLDPHPETLSDAQKNLYLQQQQYWDVNNSQIKQIAQDLKTPDAIYAYVVHHLQYDFSRVAGQQERLGAANVLQNPSSAVCLEFTDLFIALSRAAGIPAREIDGYAYTQDSKERPLSLVSDVLHAWPEYYDTNRQAWIMVDPTWENTTKGIDYFHMLDFDHVAFVVKGMQSTFPIPAGGYKVDGQQKTKDVFVTFADVEPVEPPKISVKFDGPVTLFSGLPINASITIINAGENLVPSQTIKVTTNSLTPHTQTLATGTIPPFGTVTIPLHFHQTNILTNGQEHFTIQVAGNTIAKTINIYPIFLQKQVIIGGIIIVLFSLIIFIIATKTWRILTVRSRQ